MRFEPPKLTFDMNGPIGRAARQAVSDDSLYAQTLKDFAERSPPPLVTNDNVREGTHGILSREHEQARERGLERD